MKVRFRCAECGKLTAGRKPRGGDGTLMYPRRHYLRGWLYGKQLPCKGSWSEAEWVTIKADDE